MSSADSGVPSDIVLSNSIEIVTYAAILCLTLIVYDICLTFSAEVEHIWKSTNNNRSIKLLNVLYVIQRYLAVLDVGAFLAMRLKTNFKRSDCVVSGQILFGILFLGVTLSEVILTLRTWAVLSLNPSNKHIKIGLIVFFMICWLPIYAFIGLDVNAYQAYVISSLHSRCVTAGGNKLILPVFVLLLIYDSVLSAIMIISGWRAYQTVGRRTQLVKVVYEQGIVYYLYTIVATLAVLIVIASTELQGINSSLIVLEMVVLRTLYSILTSRVVLSIKECVELKRTPVRRSGTRSLNLSSTDFMFTSYGGSTNTGDSYGSGFKSEIMSGTTGTSQSMA